jgi:HAD superfamily hydrolase (TIGR01490 family)
MIGNAMERGRIAAVFDIDGTLVPSPSLEWRLLAHLAAKREIRLAAITTWMGSLLWQMFWKRSGSQARSLMLDENKSYLAGVRGIVVEEWIAQRFAELEFFAEALAVLAWHRRQGHAIVLISGTLAPLAEAVGAMLANGEEMVVCATELETEGERWTGRVAGEAICGPAKERALIHLAAKHQLDLSRSFAYADSMQDRWLLGAVGHPTVVNPSPVLAQHARRLGWRLANWNKRACIWPPQRTLHSIGERGQQIFAEKLLWK